VYDRYEDASYPFELGKKKRLSRQHPREVWLTKEFSMEKSGGHVEGRLRRGISIAVAL